MSPPTKVTVSTAQSPDYYPIAALESLVIHSEPIIAVAFGPDRASEANLRQRAEGFGKPSTKKGEWMWVTKAVNDEGEIVGAATWKFVTGREEKREEEEKANVDASEGGWPKGANAKFCEDVFGKAEVFMMDSCEGKDYAKLGMLMVHQKYQRQGIGQQIIKHGFKEIDAKGLQCVLGASKEGLGLYKKYGFVVTRVMDVPLNAYEGGAGFENDDHAIMHRPAQKA